MYWYLSSKMLYATKSFKLIQTTRMINKMDSNILFTLKTFTKLTISDCICNVALRFKKNNIAYSE